MEKFKSTQNWEDALHAKFDYMTGDPVTNDDSWGHLQVSRGGEEVKGERERERIEGEVFDRIYHFGRLMAHPCSCKYWLR